MKKTLLLFGLTLSLNTVAAPGLWTNAKDKTLPTDFKIQGEYIGDLSCGCDIGAQVIALGGGEFQLVVYPGGLPGDGWDRGDDRSLMTGKLQGNKAVFAAAIGKRRYLGGRANEFSATSQYPPKGQKEGKAVIENGKLTGSYGKKTFELERLERKSPSLGAKAPKGAIVLFDGTGKGEWQGGRLDEQTKLLNTDGRDIRTARKFQNYTMHVEFLLPFKPAARGQGPGQQRLLSGGPLRGTDPRFVWVGREKQRVRWRLHQGRSDREHVPAAAPMANLRRGVHQCRDEGRQENQKRPHDTEA